MKFRIALLSVLVATAAYAHGPSAGPNGGQQVDAGDFHVEAVTAGNELSVFVRDTGDQPVKTEGFTGTAILIVDGKPQRISLKPAGENKLTGTSTVPLTAPKGAIQLAGPEGKSVQAKFE